MQNTFEKYQFFTQTDFILDDYFIDWVMKPDKENTQFWNLFISANPQQVKNIKDARQLITSLDTSAGKLEIDEEIKSRLWRSIESRSAITKVIELKSPKFWMVAASIIVIMLATTGYFYFSKNKQDNTAKIESNKQPLKSDVAPGGNKAILTLANGSSIVLDSAANGTLSNQGNIKIIKLNDGQLAYNKSSEENKSEALYNKVTTPRGGQYQLILSDGSKVWLNAASSLRFPTAFSGNERRVELTGEGYFEVAKNKEKPFVVTANNIEVEVLGTHFNINAYNDENVVRTTLLEGSVKVSKGSVSKIIKPGEQAQIKNQDNQLIPQILVQTADVDEVVAWKNGLFEFNQASIKTIMNQIARWYDVDVVFDDNVPDKKFDGKIYRNVNVSEVFKILEEGGIHFKIVGREVIVSP